MIKGFKCLETKKIFEGKYSKAFPFDIQRTVRRKLICIDEANMIKDLKAPPGNRLEKLKGDRLGQWSIRINNQWRLFFIWKEQHSFNLEIVDYH